jgi:DNA-binding CsgD family transcriptional regulator
MALRVWTVDAVMQPVIEHSSLREAPHTSGERPCTELSCAARRSIDERCAVERRAWGAVMPDAESLLERWVGLLRVSLRPDDVERLRADAEQAVCKLAPGSCLRSAALQMLEVIDDLAGDEGSPGEPAAQVKPGGEGEDLDGLGFHMRLAADLSAAELRLLPFLATHLSLRGIGERLFITRNTVKSEAVSAYRKLGVSSRSEAVELAAKLGLIEATVATRTGGRMPAGARELLGSLTPVGSMALVAIGLALGTKTAV